ncbi:MAG: hypothetical protein ACJ789_05365 [Thermomicrobiales bacterium]
MNDPLRQRRIGVSLVIVGALITGLGNGIRAANESGEENWTYVFAAGGLILAIAGAFFEARTADLLFEFAPGPAKRRAFLLLTIGLLVALVACVLLGAADQPALHALVGGALLLGIGFGAGGLFSLVWYYGSGYAANRVQDRAHDDC